VTTGEKGTALAIPVISADSHIDIGWLPADTFTSRVPESWRSRAPEIVDTDGGPKWVADGTVLSGVAAVGSRGRRYTRGRWQRADRMADTGLFTDGLHRPANPEARILDQDRDGVEAMIEHEVPMKRFGTPEEIADAVLFLASERSSFTTGAVLVADGGEYRG